MLFVTMLENKLYSDNSTGKDCLSKSEYSVKTENANLKEQELRQNLIQRLHDRQKSNEKVNEAKLKPYSSRNRTGNDEELERLPETHSDDQKSNKDTRNASKYGNCDLRPSHQIKKYGRSDPSRSRSPSDKFQGPTRSSRSRSNSRSYGCRSSSMSCQSRSHNRARRSRSRSTSDRYARRNSSRDSGGQGSSNLSTFRRSSNVSTSKRRSDMSRSSSTSPPGGFSRSKSSRYRSISRSSRSRSTSLDERCVKDAVHCTRRKARSRSISRRSTSGSKQSSRRPGQNSDLSRQVESAHTMISNRQPEVTLFEAAKHLGVKKSVEIKPSTTGATITSCPTLNSKAKCSQWQPISRGNNALNTFVRLCSEISAKESQVLDNVVANSEVRACPGISQEITPSSLSGNVPAHVTTGYQSKQLVTHSSGSQATRSGHTIRSFMGDDALSKLVPVEARFPVSCGVEHRQLENASNSDIHLPVYTESMEPSEFIDVGAMIARRLGAQQVLNANPSDASAQAVLADCDVKLSRWSARNRKPGRFTGEATLTRMSNKEIAGSFETWVRRDFFKHLPPVNEGVGVRLLQKMGWRQGQPLGRKGEGHLVPVPLDVKVGRGGLMTYEDERRIFSKTAPKRPFRQGKGRTFFFVVIKVRPKAGIAQTLSSSQTLRQKFMEKSKLTCPPTSDVTPLVGQGKHPVSALAELATKQKLGFPEYHVVFEHGASNQKTFLMKVSLNGVDYQAPVASSTKKLAKAQAAAVALRCLGYIT